MIEKIIKYTDYNDNEVEEKFQFALTKTELNMLNLKTTGGYQNLLERISNARDVPSMAKTFEDLIRLSYGEKSPDGKSFIKKDENGHYLGDKFMQTAAYDALFMSFINGQNIKDAIEFVMGILPKELSENARKAPEFQEYLKKYQNEVKEIEGA